MRPTRAPTAPVNAPRVWPKSSASSSASGIAAQLSTTMGLLARGLRRCSALATTSFPVPVSPSISTVVDRGATSRISRANSSIGSLCPIMSGRANGTEDAAAFSLTPFAPKEMPGAGHAAALDAQPGAQPGTALGIALGASPAASRNAWISSGRRGLLYSSLAAWPSMRSKSMPG